MHVKVQFSRRKFLDQGLKLGAAAGLVVVLPGCLGKNSTGSNDDTTTTGGCVIGTNHGHNCQGYATDSTTAITVILTDNGTHFHNVPLGADELEQIRGGATVTKNSSSAGGHTHSVQFSLP